MTEEKRKKTAVVIGAGPAGLTAAQQLLETAGSHWRVVVLEEDFVPGGISRTVVHNGNRMDLGGHRFFSKNPEVNRLWQRLMPLQGAPAKDDRMLGRAAGWAVGGPDPESEERVMLRRRRMSRIYSFRRFFDYPVSIKLATFMAMGVRRSIGAGISYIRSALNKRPERSLEDFYINRFGRVLYSMFFEGYTEKLWGIHPSKISPEWGAQRVKGLSIAKALVNAICPGRGRKETSLIEEFFYPKKGPGQYWEIMSEEVKALGGEIKYGNRVIGIERESNRVNSVTLENVVTGERQMLACDALFSSMPIRDLVAAFGSNVPSNVREVAEGLPYRDFMTVGLLVDRLALCNRTRRKTIRNIVPDTWIYVQDPDVRLGRLQIFNNWSPYMVDDIERHVWIGLEYFCSEGDDLWIRDDENFISFAVNELRQIGVLEKDEPIRDAVRVRVKKAYPAYFGLYSRFNEVREWLDQCDGLYCIGRNGQHRYNNMDHSMLCAIEAVKALLTGADRRLLWNVNTEEEYHEAR